VTLQVAEHSTEADCFVVVHGKVYDVTPYMKSAPCLPYLLFAVCSLLSAVCCLLSALCCLLYAVCCLLSALCCLLSVVVHGKVYDVTPYM
jgi:hypothetical protein